ncbi:MAG: aldehyde dehydrogenase family protein, partial [Anaerolineales bacterium]|nr:aldehyde dehydrogenase family protein [Anaerolineales bacterium]
MAEKILNYINGEWCLSSGSTSLNVHNPANQEVLAEVALTPKSEVDEAVNHAKLALAGWSRTPAAERIQYLFKLKALLEEHFDEISRLITMECGKTLGESRGEMRRAIENVEVACGIPMMMQGIFSEDIAPGIDEVMIRQPVGVCAIIAP